MQSQRQPSEGRDTHRTPRALSVRDRRPVPTRPAFTIIEIMVVVVIIGVLAGLIVPQIVGRLGRSKQSVAHQQLAQIELAINLFYTEYERHPTTLDELLQRPADIDEAIWLPPTLKPKHLLDPWGRPFVYQQPGDHDPYPFDLASFGRDGEPGGQGEDADIVSWE